MNTTNSSLWVWVSGVLLVMLLIVGALWLLRGGQSFEQAGYSASSTDALASSNVPPAPAVAAQPRAGSVTSVLASIPDTTRFANLLARSGVSLSGKGPYTLFVPVDEAFGYLPAGALNLSSAQLVRLIEYHIVAGKAIDVNLQAAGTVQALSKDVLNFSVRQGDKSARINSSVALQEYKAHNGVIYLINQVLLPPTQ